MKKILVPTDFHKPAQWACEVAGIIADQLNAEITLLNIIEQPYSESFNIEGEMHLDTDAWEDRLYTMKLIETSKNKLAEAAARLEEKGITVKQELRMGNPYHGIRTLITDHQVDLIVMGTSSDEVWEGVTVGSNAERVVRFAACPVLTVHNRCGDFTSITDIVYATSLSEDENTFSNVVKQAQSIFNATVHLVRINTPMNFLPDDKVKKLMQGFATKNKIQNYTLNTFSDYNEEQGIVHFANAVNAGLIAMATHGRTGIARVLAGSIAEDVVSRSIRPVLTGVVK